MFAPKSCFQEVRVHVNVTGTNKAFQQGPGVGGRICESHINWEKDSDELL